MDSNIKIGDFFSLQNSVESINESDYEKVGLIIEAAKAFERSTYQCVYIIDYFKKGFLYVSNNIARLCGGEAEKIKDFGYKFYRVFSLMFRKTSFKTPENIIKARA